MIGCQGGPELPRRGIASSTQERHATALPGISGCADRATVVLRLRAQLAYARFISGADRVEHTSPASGPWLFGAGTPRSNTHARRPQLVRAAGCPRHRAKSARPVLQADVDLVGVRFWAGACDRRPDRGPEDIAAAWPRVERDADRDLGVRIVTPSQASSITPPGNRSTPFLTANTRNSRRSYSVTSTADRPWCAERSTVVASVYARSSRTRNSISRSSLPGTCGGRSRPTMRSRW